MYRRFVISKYLLSCAIVLSATLCGASCINEIDRVTDCQDICSRYSDCFDKSYDIEACRTRCSDNARDDASFDQHVDLCENCFDDRPCTSTLFACGNDCSTIVP